MDRQCKKCGGRSQDVLAEPAAKCPACGAFYVKVDATFNAQLQAKTPVRRSLTSPRTGIEWLADGILIAFMIGFTVFIASSLLRGNSPSAAPPVKIDPRKTAGEIPRAPTPAVEQSSFFVKYPSTRKAQWPLRSGGTNYSYSFLDPDHPGQSFGVEVSPDAGNITRASVSWYGTSISAPARLTPWREQFLRDWLRAVFPEIDVAGVLEIAREQQEKNYDGGSKDMPRNRVSGFDVIAGTVASSLHVAVER